MAAVTDPEKELTRATHDDEIIEVRHVLIVANPKAGGFSEIDAGEDRS